jgi:hypothetical protein
MGYPAYPLLPTLYRIAQILRLDEADTAQLLALAEAANERERQRSSDYARRFAARSLLPRSE